MINICKLIDVLLVLLQIVVVDLFVFYVVGICVIICNWFDGEGVDQLIVIEICVVVVLFGIDVYYLLVDIGKVIDDQVV